MDKLKLEYFVKDVKLTESLATTYKDTKSLQPILQKLLTATMSLANRTQEAHWNVKGPNFGPLHELFGDFYGFLADTADTLAERIVQLDGEAVANPSGPTLYGKDKQLLMVITKGATELAKEFKAAIEEAQKSDEVTGDIFIESGRELEKWLWKIESHLKIVS